MAVKKSNPKAANPCGNDYRKARREKAAAERANEEKRAGGRAPLPNLDDPAFIHLRLIEAGWQRLAEIRADKQLTAEQRWRLENETTKSLANVQTKADLQREVERLRQDLLTAQVALQVAQRELERERREHALGVQ